LSGRVEYFRDAHAVMIIPQTGTEGFKAGSVGLCLNIKADEHALFRIEGRKFFGYTGKNISTSPRSDIWLCGNMSVWF
ncbi:MAG: porin, partial [Bacteroidetes bacterium]|nr:porin [Bacteroidota bacterium]